MERLTSGVREDLREITAGLLSFLYEVGAGDYTPIGDRVLVRPLVEEAGREGRKVGSLYVPLQDKREGFGLVISVGPKVKEHFDAGDLVVTGALVGHPIHIHGVEHRLVPYQDILAKILSGAGEE